MTPRTGVTETGRLPDSVVDIGRSPTDLGGGKGGRGTGMVAAMAAMWNSPHFHHRDSSPPAPAPASAPAQLTPPRMSSTALAAQRGQRGGKVAEGLRGKVAAMEAAALDASPGYQHQSQRQGPAAKYLASLSAAEEARTRAAVTVQALYRGFRTRKLPTAQR